MEQVLQKYTKEWVDMINPLFIVFGSQNPKTKLETLQKKPDFHIQEDKTLKEQT